MMDFNEDEYLDIEQRQEVRNKARMFRRKYIRYNPECATRGIGGVSPQLAARFVRNRALLAK